MSDCEGKAGQSSHDKVQNLTFVKMRVFVMQRSRAEGQEEQAEQKDRGYAELSVLQVSAKEGGTGDEEGDCQNDGLRRFSTKIRAGNQGKQRDQHGHSQAVYGARHRQGHAHPVKCSPSS